MVFSPIREPSLANMEESHQEMEAKLFSFQHQKVNGKVNYLGVILFTWVPHLQLASDNLNPRGDMHTKRGHRRAWG